MAHMGGWIGVDLDGTLAKYDGWHGVKHIGQPIEALVFRVRQWLNDDRLVKVFTARVGPQPSDEERQEAEKAIQLWCLEHIGQVLEVTATKDYSMIELWDDRAIQVEPNTGRRVDGK